MKVLLLSEIRFPEGHASINRILTYAKGFIYNGVDTRAVFFTSKVNKNIKFQNEGIYEGVPYSILHKDIYIKETRIARLFNFLIGLFRVFPFLLKEKKKHPKLRVILVSTVPSIFFIIGIFCRLIGVEYYVEVCEYPNYMKGKELTLNRWRKFILSVIYKPFNGMIFETQRLREFFMQFISIEQKVIVIPTTMEYDDIVESVGFKEKNYIAYAGSVFSEEKDGLLKLLEAFSIIQKDRSDLYFFFIGRIANNSYHNQLIARAKKLNVSSKVVFTGSVPRKEFITFLKGAKVMLVAKGGDSFYSGGLSSKVVEYLFAKRPTVIVSSDDYELYLEDNKDVLIAPNDDSSTIARCIELLLDDKSLANNIALSGYNKAFQFFDYRKSVKYLIDFLA